MLPLRNQRSLEHIVREEVITFNEQDLTVR
jgi:hypothetical protein